MGKNKFIESGGKPYLLVGGEESRPAALVMGNGQKC
jgi:hypothetical protein